MKTIGERIRQAREARKISGEALAKLVGYKNQSAIGNLENRAGGTGGNKIAEIAAALKVPVGWLLTGPDSEIVPDTLEEPALSGANHALQETPPGVYTIPKKPAPDLSSLDPWAREAAEIIGRLQDHEKPGAIANLRTYVHNLGPPRAGQALSMAGK